MEIGENSSINYKNGASNSLLKEKNSRLNNILVTEKVANVGLLSNNFNAFETTKSLYIRVISALFYAIASMLIVFINKIILTNYKFPSPQFLGLGQMFATIFILQSAKSMGIISFCDFSRDLPSKVWPLPLFYIGNLVSGLDGTKRLSLPMFTVLRRFTILLTMIGEYVILRVRARNSIIMSVLAMVGGAFIAATNDLAFDSLGYLYVLLNDCFTAGNNIFVKKKLTSRDMGRYGLIFYNALFMILPLLVTAYLTGELLAGLTFNQWHHFGFQISFLGSCLMGFILMYATVLCTQNNSALTTTIVGCLKNIIVTYFGMFIGGDYVFSLPNFMGINISMIGSLVYTYLTFVQKEKKPDVLLAKDVSQPT